MILFSWSSATDVGGRLCQGGGGRKQKVFFKAGNPRRWSRTVTGASATVPCELAATHPMVDEMDAGGSRGICGREKGITPASLLRSTLGPRAPNGTKIIPPPSIQFTVDRPVFSIFTPLRISTTTPQGQISSTRTVAPGFTKQWGRSAYGPRGPGISIARYQSSRHPSTQRLVIQSQRHFHLVCRGSGSCISICRSVRRFRGRRTQG